VTDLAASYRSCRRVVRSSGSNFPWTFYVLPADKRRAMDALYAFARRTDDIGDGDEEVETKRSNLMAWREELNSALAGKSEEPLLPAVVDAVRRFHIPEKHLFEIIDGVERDLSPVRFETTQELHQYCHLVASSVGAACVHIWGYTSDRALVHAATCGVAFQMTNILRDLREDVLRDRVYLPYTDLVHHGVSLDDLRTGANESGLRKLLDLQFESTRAAFQLGRQTMDYLSRDGQRIFSLMYGTYHTLFQKLQRQGVEILRRRQNLGFAQKLAIAARCLFGVLP